MDTRTITIDGEVHEVTKFSDAIQQTVSLYNALTVDLQREQLAVIKTQAAIQHVGTQLGAAVRAELDQQKTATEASSETKEE